MESPKLPIVYKALKHSFRPKTLFFAHSNWHHWSSKYRYATPIYWAMPAFVYSDFHPIHLKLIPLSAWKFILWIVFSVNSEYKSFLVIKKIQKICLIKAQLQQNAHIPLKDTSCICLAICTYCKWWITYGKVMQFTQRKNNEGGWWWWFGS